MQRTGKAWGQNGLRGARARWWGTGADDAHASRHDRANTAAALAEERMRLFGTADISAARERGAILCLSGGGVRSAAISLGVLQALASWGLLTRFHWLSTVSGGGYTGSWLQAWIHTTQNAARGETTQNAARGDATQNAARGDATQNAARGDATQNAARGDATQNAAGGDATQNAAGGDATQVEAALGREPEPPEVKRLREWCNYLTPQPGLLSADTWTAVTLWVRNVLVNWMVFGPVLLALATGPIAYAALLSRAGAAITWSILGAGITALLSSTLIACLWLPSHVDPPASKRGTLLSAKGVRELVVLPVLVWSAAVPFWWRELLRPPLREACRAFWHQPVIAAPHACFGYLPWQSAIVPACAVIVMSAAYGGVWVWGFPGASEQRSIFRRNLPSWLFACAAAAAVLLAGGQLAAGLSDVQLAVLGPPWVVLAHLVQSMLYVGLRANPARGDLDREWLARVSATKAMAAIVWLALASTVALLPAIVLQSHLPGSLAWIDLHIVAFGAAAASGGLAAKLGKSARTAGATLIAEVRKRFHPTAEAVLTASTVVFAVTLYMLLGSLGGTLLDVATGWLGGAVAAVVVVAGLAGLGAFADQHINVNRFSMNATYRNRLSRSFLGSTIPPEQRKPDPWTGFDPFDNPRMADLNPQAAGRSVLMPLIGLTVNLAGGNRWPERKGRPFTVTPLRAGFGEMPPARPEMGGTFASTAGYGGGERETGVDDPGLGLTLATAMTLSGAAVSPNMGFHSSPATAFLMTLFNVRLGAWLPNPARAGDAELNQARPPRRALLREMVGRTDDAGRAIYLSDGGHFDNLGLYEALRRRPALVVAIDAGHDPLYGYADLAATLRKLHADLDVAVTFTPPLVVGQAPAEGWTTAAIRYAEDSDQRPATLIYIKASKPAALSPTLQAFAARESAFPHTPTADQFFTETQFESYRELGQMLAQAALTRVRMALRSIAPLPSV